MIPDTHSSKVIGCAIDIHRAFGPGLLESAYEDMLAIELTAAGVPFVRQAPISLSHKGQTIGAAYRADLFVGDDLIVEIKAVDNLAPIHRAQVLTYLKLSGRPVGLLINFNMLRLKDGIVRLVQTRPTPRGPACAACGPPRV